MEGEGEGRETKIRGGERRKKEQTDRQTDIKREERQTDRKGKKEERTDRQTDRH